MPTTAIKNRLYQAALPLAAPSPRGRMRHERLGQPLTHFPRYERLLCRHHVFGASLLLVDGERRAAVYTSTEGNIVHPCNARTLFRVASITKMVTALAVLRLESAGLLHLDDQAAAYLPDGNQAEALRGVTLRHLLTHTAGLRDIPAVDAALAAGDTWLKPMAQPAIRGSQPGEVFAYCNFGYGLLGCVLEAVTGEAVSEVLRKTVIDPLGLRAELDASRLNPAEIMPITRVLPYHPNQDTVITPLGAKPLNAADPLRHFGHTAGALYTDAESLSTLLHMIANEGKHQGSAFLPPEAIREMTACQAAYGAIDPRLTYGLGLLRVTDRTLSQGPIIGHQGFAYGCADGAFVDTETGRQVIFLNGGCSEARAGRLGQCNRDVLRYALREEMPTW